PHVALHVSAFPRPLAEEGMQRHAQRAAQSGELLARIRGSLDHLEHLGELEDVGQLDRSRQPQPAGERARRADVCDGEFLARGHTIPPPRRHRRPHDGPVDPPPCHLCSHAPPHLPPPPPALPPPSAPPIPLPPPP